MVRARSCLICLTCPRSVTVNPPSTRVVAIFGLKVILCFLCSMRTVCLILQVSIIRGGVLSKTVGVVTGAGQEQNETISIYSID